MFKSGNTALLTMRDADIFPNQQHDHVTEWKERPTGKVVLFSDADEIALVSNSVSGIFLLPGGGIADGEDIISGTKRECREETGYEIEILRELGVTEDFRARDSRHCITHGYEARVLSQCPMSLTESESDIDFFVQWFPFDAARTLFTEQEERVGRGEVPFYNTCFNIIRDSFFVRRSKIAE